MKQLNFRLVIVVVLLALTVNLNAQEKTKKGFIPDEIAVQYAGNIGIVSVGAGWNYAKNNCLGTTFAIGYVPDYHSYHGSACFSLREEYTPWKVKMGEVAAFRPLDTQFEYNSRLLNLGKKKDPLPTIDKIEEMTEQEAKVLLLKLLSGKN